MESKLKKTPVMPRCRPEPGRFASGLVVMFCLLWVFSGMLCLPVVAEQTKDQCRECCRKAGHDEYYLDQCLLRCHRNPEHCLLAQGSRGQAPEDSPRTSRPAGPPPDGQPAAPTEQPRSRPTERPFQWPNPLSLTPGKEIEAAAQILMLNGVPQNHPQFPVALKAVEGVLVNFVRSNPSGGKLPAAQLERVMRQFRQ